ncbi:chromatin remodeling complex protein [Dendrothele bispora CBS 962.96]|uniref:Chromatin remodeling complex protein n=1 Tax=Dendrothele bispora (strain CBS 962.96) TaxID=1314807 RepID=A0A4V4HFG2_DENBC|nr:chromatin remodeling complex protein [Dendrothele bispora CBS 962.96]
MPTCRRKRVVLTEPSQSLVQSVKTHPDRKVFLLQQTGEIFDSYEAYAARMSFYRLKQFQCEVTGKSGLDYFQAVESERQEARTLHSRFSEPLKPAVLKAVQWQVVGRLDHLVEAVYERFKDRYFKGEKVLVDLSGIKYHAMVDRVYPPKYSTDPQARDAHKGTSSSRSTIDDEKSHNIEGDLKIPVKDVNAKDDPNLYYYWVHILEMERDKNDKNKAAKSEESAQMIGSLMEVQCGRMSRDRLSFSKSILRRFIRDCVDRDAAVASPWTVKPAIAQRYGVNSVMPEETRKGVESLKKGESDKRKKVWEEKEGPPTKKQKKLAASQEEKAKAAALAAEKREREAQEKLEKQREALEEAERIAAEKKKKKPIRYPTEDLDVRITDKDKKAGMKVKRPVPSRVAIPFNDTPGTFEAFLMAWNFLIVYGQPLHLSTFTLDEFEHAVRHSVTDLPCTLLAEVHSTLIYNLRTVPFQRHSAVLSLLRLKEDLEEDGKDDAPMLGITIEDLTAAMADVGNNWERVPLRASEGREGWEDALLGCLKDHATLLNFPRLREVLTKLLFAPDSSQDASSSPSSSRVSSPDISGTQIYTVTSSPSQRYHALPPRDRIAILSFMTTLAISSKAIHTHMESCEEQLTALRKEKIEVNRQKKQYTEEMNTLMQETKEDPTPSADDDTTMQDQSDLSDAPTSDNGSDSTSKSKKKKGDLRQKAQLQAHAKQREAARAKEKSVKQAMAEHRRLDEEVNKLERRLEAIEREFRKLLGGVRVKPMGKDRFHNRIWWFDGLGSASLVGSGGVTQYGAGRLFIQGPSEFDAEILERRQDEDIVARRMEEEGEEGMLGSGDWAVYSDLEELDEYVAWLNTKGHRELALKQALTKWWTHITAGVRKRQADVANHAKLPEARRSTRTKATYDVTREPYMMWTNRRAVNAS